MENDLAERTEYEQRSNHTFRNIALVGAATTATLAAYRFAVGPWQRTWGATPEEVVMAMPADDEVAVPKYDTTRAITIHAPVSDVWPWLVQMGQGRGGLYTYDWMENLAGLKMHSVDRIIPELQELAVGDVIPLAPGGMGMTVTAMEPERSFVLSAHSDEMSCTWVWVLHEVSSEETRLVARWRAAFEFKKGLSKGTLEALRKAPRATMAGLFIAFFIDPGEFIMERGMLLGIKQRAEKLARERARSTEPVSSEGRQPTKSAAFKTPKGQIKYLDSYEETLKLWPVPYQSLYVPTRFGTTHVIVSGPENAPPLLLIHGYATSATMWYPTIGDLSRSYRTYAVDVIGQPGKSVPAQVIHDSESYVEWLVDVFDGLKIEKAPLMGLSFGGWIAASFAVAAPERVERLMLLAPAATFVPLKPQFFVRGMSAAMIPFRPLVNSMLRWFYAKGHKPEESFARQFAAGIMEYRAWNPVYPTVLNNDQLRSLNMPVLLMEGSNEVICDPEGAIRRAVRLVPNLEVELIPNAAHVINAEQPEIINTCLLTFLAKGRQSTDDSSHSAHREFASSSADDGQVNPVPQSVLEATSVIARPKRAHTTKHQVVGSR